MEILKRTQKLEKYLAEQEALVDILRYTPFRQGDKRRKAHAEYVANNVEVRKIVSWLINGE